MVKTDRRMRMDNNTPNYAKWIPEAGGYVQNGAIVSTTPVYDSTGRQLETIQQDTQASGMGAAAASGVATANQKGSSQDVNQTATDIGSLGSMSDNTTMTTTGVLDTNATKSPLVKEPVLSPLDQAKKDYEYMVATNNLQGQINALQQLSNLEGADYSAQISQLQQQRDTKIKDIDDQYLAAYNQALAAGDTAKADQILAQQDAWRQSVGYQGAMQNMRQREEQALRVEWEDTYRAGIDQITQSILQLTGNILNFQYNPNNDMALQIAQGYAVGKIKEQMNSTGMYYSSMTQNAITKAVAELVPVYEKMAKEELRDNLQTLQSTANYLMNLEESQFKLWEAQIEMQWNANNERRKEVAAAIDTANARGYFSNEEAALLGVTPGTLSPSAREHLQSVQEQIDKEERALEQDKALAKYKVELALQQEAEEQRLSEYYKEKYLAYSQQFKEPTTVSSTGNQSYTYTIDKDGNVTTKITSSVPLSNPNNPKSIYTNMPEEVATKIQNTSLADMYNKFSENKDRTSVEEEQFIKTINNGSYTADDVVTVLTDMMNQQVAGKFSSQTTEEAADSIIEFAQTLENAGIDSGIYAQYLGEKLFEDISKKSTKGENVQNKNYAAEQRQILLDKIEESDIEALKAYTLSALMVGFGDGLYTYENGVVKDVTQNVKDAAKAQVGNILNKQGRNNI